MKIGIIGCGIAGTAVAYLLAQLGHDIELFEQAAECRPVGAGILLQPSGQRILDRIGILDQVTDVAAPLQGLSAILKSGRQLVQLNYDQLEPGLKGLGVHRGELFSLLLSLCQSQPRIKFHTQARIEKTGSEASRHWVEDAAGRRRDQFDFLISTDGSASSIRSSSGIKSKVIVYDYAALWATGPCDYQPGRLVQIVDGTQKLVGLLPIGGRRSSFFWGLPASEFESLRASSFDSWKREVIGLCGDAESMVSDLKCFDELTFARYRHVSMNRWHNESTVFLGDAGHATSPHLGQGVNLALEDAACFADALAQSGDFAQACRQYSQIRKSKLRYYSQLTRILSPFFQSPGWTRGALRDGVLPWLPSLPMIGHEMLRTLCGFKNGWFR